VCEAVLEGHTNGLLALAVLPDGRLASASWDKTVLVLRTSTGVFEAMLEGHTSYVYALAVLPDGRLASGSYDKTVRVWS
jgi:WD40 repeat protein